VKAQRWFQEYRRHRWRFDSAYALAEWSDTITASMEFLTWNTVKPQMRLLSGNCEAHVSLGCSSSRTKGRYVYECEFWIVGEILAGLNRAPQKRKFYKGIKIEKGKEYS
jgi:hypothetical protein